LPRIQKDVSTGPLGQVGNLGFLGPFDDTGALGSLGQPGQQGMHLIHQVTDSGFQSRARKIFVIQIDWILGIFSQGPVIATIIIWLRRDYSAKQMFKNWICWADLL